MQRSTSIVLEAPAQQIWDRLQTDATTLDPAILRFEVDPAPGLGARNTITFRGPFGLRLRAVSEVEAWEPPHRYAARSIRPSWPIRSRAEDVLEELEGTTRYTVTISVRPRAGAGPLGRLWLRYMISTREQMMRRLEAALDAADHGS